MYTRVTGCLLATVVCGGAGLAQTAAAQDASMIADFRALRARMEQMELRIAEQDRLLKARQVVVVRPRREPDRARIVVGPDRAKTPALQATSVAAPEASNQRNARRVEFGPPTTSTQVGPLPPSKWYDRLSLRGYVQTRFNEIVAGDRDGRFSPDSSVGRNRSFLIRRARLILSGDVSNHLYVYVQPDFASTPGGATTGNFAQLRDAYGDVYIDDKKEFRVRVGQSKIPFSFENMQSSQNRLSLDRNDALNTCCRDERDVGAFFYYTPAHLRHVFRDLVTKNLKGSGDFGLFAFGAYNGQGANRVELNENVHLVSRVTYPYTFANGQIVEAGVQGLTGRFVPPTASISTGRAAPAISSAPNGFRDSRVGVHAILYPQPFGLQAEYNWGVGPRLNEAQNAVTTRSLEGGYIQAFYKYDDRTFNTGTYFPFVKYQYFNGGSKFEVNAPLNKVRDLEIGLEWQPLPEFEITTEYAKLNRTNVFVPPFRSFRADVIRTQFQFNY